MLKRSVFITLLVCFLLILGAACQPSGASVPAAPTATSVPAIREALIDSIDIQMQGSSPLQINVVAHGHLTEACAQLSDVKQRYEPHEFQIAILTTSPTDRGCAQVTTPFDKVIPLDVANLPAGAYTVVVNGVRDSFRLATDNVPPAAPAVTPTVEAGGSINGWLWHDWCPVSGQPLGAGKDTTGCVPEGDHYRANGIKENNEAIIPYVKVNLGAGPCPSIGLAETDTLVTDLSYSFTGLKAGTYCVSIDPLAGSNQAGTWTYPNRQGGTISTTITLGVGENKFDINFGWDYIDLPSTTSAACTYRAAFLGDVSVPDNTIIAPGESFVKTWRLRNDGNCAWGPGQYVRTLVFFNGDRLGALDEVPLLTTVPSGGVADVSINMVAPRQPGTYRSEWMLMVAEGPLFGVGRDGQTPLYAQIVVSGSTPPPPTGCQDSAQYVSDDGNDGITYAPNIPFIKTWKLRNTGTCTWGSNYLVAYLSGTTMTQQPGYWIVQPGQTVAPGQTVDISVGMTSPVDKGEYVSYWGLKKANGPFMPIQGGAHGNSFYAKIRVDDGDGHPQLGTLTGRLSYPSSFIPPLRVVFYSLADGRISHTDTNMNQGTYTINLPEGTYTVIAYPYSADTYTPPAPGTPVYAGGYTQAVPCGLRVECTDHSLIPVSVVAGQTATADPVDWYAPVGTFAPMPTP